jgi:hypothetical protein
MKLINLSPRAIKLANDYLLDTYDAALVPTLSTDAGFDVLQVETNEEELVRTLKSRDEEIIDNIFEEFSSGEYKSTMYDEDFNLDFSDVIKAAAFPEMLANSNNPYYKVAQATESEFSKVAAFRDEITSCRAYVPYNVVDIDYSEILNIFPAAEQNCFMLALGRALCEIDSAWRYATIIKGDPGIGKSTLFDCILKHSAALGYTSSIFNDLGKRFGLESIINKDIAYCDDLQDSSLSSMLTSVSFKSIVSGALIRTEAKGASEREVRAQATVFCNINKFNTQLLYSMDEGALDRLLVLECKSAASLETNFYENLRELENQYDCTEADIFYALFRQAVNLYAEEAEHIVTIVKALKATLKFKIIANAQYKIIDLMKVCWHQKHQKPVRALSADLFMEAIVALQDVAASSDRGGLLDLINDISSDGLEFAAHDCLHQLAQGKKLGLSKAIELGLAEFRLNNGYKLPASTSAISNLWNSDLDSYKLYI